ncbi:MAG: hypothetical protein ACREQ5_29955, partial [Candidatus Dormibacteria bacterium]
MGVGMLAAATVALAVGTGLLPAARVDSQASCSWRISARVLYQELQVETSDRAVRLRNLLEGAGVGTDGFVPVSCTGGS